MANYKTSCVNCDGNNSLYVTPHNGVSYCFKCGYYENNGEIRTIRCKERSPYINEIRHFYTAMAKYYHSCLTTQARDFLYRRGYTDELIKDKMIGYCPYGQSNVYTNNIAKIAGITCNTNEGFLAGRITFPYYKGAFVTDIRGRSIQDNDVKYKSPYGDSYTRGADYPYNYNAAIDCDRIVITEGEIKSDLSAQVGIPTIGLPGMRIWKNGFIPQANQKIIICFDSQIENTSDVDRAIYQIAQHIESPKIATLPLMNQHKMDIDSFIIQFGAELYKMIIDSAIDFQSWLKLKRMTHERNHILR